MQWNENYPQHDEIPRSIKMSETEWRDYLCATFSQLVSPDGPTLSFDIPPGWRPTVEDALETVQKQATPKAGFTADHPPHLCRMECNDTGLLLQVAHATPPMLLHIHNAMASTRHECECCGTYDEALVESDIQFQSKRFPGGKSTRVRRLCRDCDTTINATQVDPARSVQVMQAIAKGTSRQENQVLEDYARVLVQQRTPVAMIPDLHEFKIVLDREFPWFRSVTACIVRRLVARQAGSGWFKIRPLLLCGPPGCGKTSYARCIATLVDTPWQLIPLAGENTSMSLRGAARGWGTARPGLVPELIMQSRIANPILILDEIEKAGGSRRNGNVHETLIQLLEEETASRFFDGYLQGAMDLSWVTWIATANDYRQLPAPLLNRFQRVEVPMPAKADYRAIIERTVRRYARECGIRPEMMPNLEPVHWHWLMHNSRSPRTARRATEELLGALLSSPALAGEQVQ